MSTTRDLRREHFADLPEPWRAEPKVVVVSLLAAALGRWANSIVERGARRGSLFADTYFANNSLLYIGQAWHFG
jgi:hypothetical protein